MIELTEEKKVPWWKKAWALAKKAAVKATPFVMDWWARKQAKKEEPKK